MEDAQPETVDAEIPLRIHGPEDCKYFREVRQSALDTLIDLPPLHTDKLRNVHHSQTQQEFASLNLLFVALLVKLNCCIYLGFWRNPRSSY